MRAVAPVVPASFAQRRMWVFERLHPGRASYNIPLTYRLCGSLNIGALQRSLDTLVQRHVTLRTSLRLDAGEVVQVISPTLQVPIGVLEMAHASAAERFDAALAAAIRQAAEPFDLERAPLLRATLYRLDTDDHVLALCLHHAIFDSWSEGVFLRELAVVYGASQRGSEPPPLSSLRCQYADFATAQHQQAATARTETNLAESHTRLTEALYRLNLPFDFPRPSERTSRGGLEALSLPGQLVLALERFSKRHDVTMLMTLLAAYGVVLHRYSGDDEIVVGVVHEGRPSKDLEEIVGCFASTVGLAVDLRGNPSFVTILNRIRQTLLNASHQDEPSKPQLFQAMFAVQASPHPVAPFGDVHVTPVAIHNGTSKSDLFLSITADEPQCNLCCRLEFDADVFVAQTAARILASYKLLLESVVAEAERPVGILPVVSELERSQIARWSWRASRYPQTSSVHREFEAVAAATPTAVALSLGSEQLTYAKLNARANQLAWRLRHERVQRGELVGVCVDRSLAAIVAQLAILKAGAAYLPLDPLYPPSRLGFMLEDAGVRLALVSRTTSGLLPQSAAKMVCLEDEASSIDGESTESVVDDVGGDDLAYVMYTSGSTGRPNGVRIPHRGVLRLVLGTDYIDWQRATTWLQMASLSFDAATFEVWGALLHGARLVVFPDRVPTVPSLAQTLSTERVDCLWLTAALFNVVTDEHPECLSGVSQLLVGGEALSVSHVLRAQKLVPTVDLINGYGPTECTTFACCYSIPRLSPGHRQSIPIGRPIGNTTVHVWDRRKQAVPIGVRGELYIGGDGVALGYHARPELTAERFIPDPASPNRSLYRTGDLVRWRPDGVIEFLGRNDAQVKIRGFRVEPGEIEATCCRHPAVRDAVVLAVPGTIGEDSLVAFVAKDAQSSLSSAEMREFLTRNLPQHLVPATVVVRNAFPLTPNGKVDRDALLAMHRELRDDGRERRDRPRTATEESLVQVWRELLRVDEVDVHDDFFAIGGHSLLAVRMFSRIHSLFGRSLPFGTLLQHPTIAELATVLERATAGSPGASSLVRLKPGGNRPPIFFVHGIGNEVFTFRELAGELPTDQPVFGVLPSVATAEQLQSIEEIASAYLADIEKVVQDGPFVLGGHCSGAVAAFEMARQRRLRGQTVPLLVVFDYWFRDEPAGMLSAGRNFINWVFDDFLPSGFRNNVGRVRSKLRLLRGRMQRVVTRRPSPDDVRDLLGMWRYPDHEVERLRRSEETIAAYRFSPLDSPIHVFRARTRRLRMQQPPADMGWGEIAQGPLRIETVPGSHDSMFKHPFVRTLARRLEAIVDEHLSQKPA